MQRTILVEEEVRVPVVQYPCALGRQHEQLVASVRDAESSAFVFASTERVTIGIYLCFTSLVKFFGNVLVARGV